MVQAKKDEVFLKKQKGKGMKKKMGCKAHGEVQTAATCRL